MLGHLIVKALMALSWFSLCRLKVILKESFGNKIFRQLICYLAYFYYWLVTVSYRCGQFLLDYRLDNPNFFQLTKTVQLNWRFIINTFITAIYLRWRLCEILILIFVNNYAFDAGNVVHSLRNINP